MVSECITEFTAEKKFTVREELAENRKRASLVSHTKCMCHIGCLSKAVSGNMVKFS